MPLHILGLNHNTAPVEIREQVVFTGDEIDHALAQVVALEGVGEAVVLSTCNRTEFYVDTNDEGLQRVRLWLQQNQHLSDAA